LYKSSGNFTVADFFAIGNYDGTPICSA